MTLGERLRGLREERGLYIRHVADNLNVAVSTIAGYEKYNKNPNNEMLKKLADFYGVTVDYLLCRVEERDTCRLDKDNLPRALREIGIEYLIVAKEMQDKEISPETIKEIIALIQKHEK